MLNSSVLMISFYKSLPLYADIMNLLACLIYGFTTLVAFKFFRFFRTVVIDFSTELINWASSSFFGCKTNCNGMLLTNLLNFKLKPQDVFMASIASSSSFIWFTYSFAPFITIFSATCSAIKFPLFIRSFTMLKRFLFISSYSSELLMKFSQCIDFCVLCLKRSIYISFTIYTIFSGFSSFSLATPDNSVSVDLNNFYSSLTCKCCIL